MNKIINYVFAILFSFAIIGCDSLPTAEEMAGVAKSVGVAAALVANNTKLDAADKTVITSVVEKVIMITPTDGKTFAETWTPIANECLDKALLEKKIEQSKRELVAGTFKIVCSAIDYLFDVRYPTARKYNDLIAAAITGFGDGFINSFKSNDKFATTNIQYDKEAFDYLNSKMVK